MVEGPWLSLACENEEGEDLDVPAVSIISLWMSGVGSVEGAGGLWIFFLKAEFLSSWQTGGTEGGVFGTKAYFRGTYSGFTNSA
jgi:hypothetical protein